MLLLISKQSDAQILRDKVKTVTQTNDLFVLRDGRLFSINHTFDNSDHISRVGWGLQRCLDRDKLRAARDDSINRFDSIRQLSRMIEVLGDIGVQ